jgi:hypothetical protein
MNTCQMARRRMANAKAQDTKDMLQYRRKGWRSVDIRRKSWIDQTGVATDQPHRRRRRRRTAILIVLISVRSLEPLHQFTAIHILISLDAV